MNSTDPPADHDGPTQDSPSEPARIELGAFSASLAVADLPASVQFYRTLGFEIVDGDPEAHFVVLRNGEASIGLFHGLFEGNVLTFNPGLNARGQAVDPFLDVREIARHLESAGLHLTTPLAADAGDSGPAHIALVDPDGNAVLIDQHR